MSEYKNLSAEMLERLSIYDIQNFRDLFADLDNREQVKLMCRAGLEYLLGVEPEEEWVNSSEMGEEEDWQHLDNSLRGKGLNERSPW